jgi:hypothetical protein
MELHYVSRTQEDDFSLSKASKPVTDTQQECKNVLLKNTVLLLLTYLLCNACLFPIFDGGLLSSIFLPEW